MQQYVQKTMSHRRSMMVPAALAAFFGLCAAALACNVPVFRYALERWNPDAYEVFVFLDKPATAEERKLIDAMRAQVVGAEQQLDSFYVYEVDVAAGMDDRVRAVHDAVKPAAYPHLLVQFPKSDPSDPPVYSGALTAEPALHLADSPARRAVAKQILEGESVVWVLLESGDKAKDDAARALLSKELKRLQGELKLPALDETDDAFHDPEAGPKLRLSFAVLRLPRGDAKEAMFIRSLENWDPDLVNRQEPMAFAVFGRGRVMPPLYGKYLTPSFLEEACGFIIGRCSCQVKEENPGWDLLMPVNWDAVMRGRVSLTEAMPKLTTASAAVAENDAIERAVSEATSAVSRGDASAARSDAPAAMVARDSTTRTTGSATMLWAAGAVVAAALVIVTVGTLCLRRRAE